jgi:predicted TIM-barrel fold metal-dependent hydrolase
MVIDIFPHLISERVLGFLMSRKEFRFRPAPDNGDIDARLAVMERYGIDIQAISPTTPILVGLNPMDAAEVCKMSNDDNAVFCRAHPERFVNICMFSLLDVGRAMKELERSVNELDCRGITIASNQNGKGLDSPEYFPFYEKLVEYDLPILIHPIDWERYPLTVGEDSFEMMGIFGWPFDTTQAVWRLICNGVLDRFPSLKIVMHHLGAMFPYFAGRMKTAAPLTSALKRPFEDYWSNIYGDTAVSQTAAALPCGYAFFGAERMVFGTDYPFGPENGLAYIRDNFQAVKNLDIPEHEREMILAGNAKKLLKID